MSKFFRIKSKPKINVGRRETSKNVQAGASAEEPFDCQNAEGADKQLQENLGKALEQQLSKRYEEEQTEPTNPGPSANLPSEDTCSNAGAEQTGEGPANHTIEQPFDLQRKKIFSNTSRAKMNTRREISFDDSVRSNQNDAENLGSVDKLLAAEPDETFIGEQSNRNTSISKTLNVNENKSFNEPQKVYFRVKSKPKFNTRNKPVPEIHKNSIVNSSCEDDKEICIKNDSQEKPLPQTSEENVDSVSSSHTSSKTFSRVNSKPIIESERLTSSEAIHTEKDQSLNVESEKENYQNTVENIQELNIGVPEFNETHELPGSMECQKDESCNISLQGNVVIKEQLSTASSVEQAPNTTTISNNVDYPPPPPSPTKINRIKAVPRFSESDGSRHHGRIRNVSVCSVMSSATEGVTDNAASKEVLPMIQKKIIRTEQSRKLAEARKEFQKRFGVKSPDKQKLKMIDLLFYNPTSNPMQEPREKKPLKIEKSEDREGDNSLAKNEGKSESSKTDERHPEEDDALVPQIKIGPNGEIILDEQSLVIENQDIQRQKQDILNSDIVDGDFNSGYGVFKRTPRAKDWTHKETLRFYKALNVLGTDFSLMAELFPNRSRREIKMKFKKEDKVNGALINKAITLPCCYNYDQLKHDFRTELEEEKELLMIAEKEADKRMKRKLKRKQQKQQDLMNADIKPKKPKRSRSPGSRLVSREFDSDSSSDEEEAIKKVVLEDDEIAEDEDSGSEEEAAMPILLPTRSGRLPKSRNAEQAQLVSMPPPQLPEPTLLPRSRRTSSVSSTVSNESNLENVVIGSIMVMAEDGLDGKPVYKSYMVTPERSLTPLNVESEVIAKVIDYNQSDQSEAPESDDREDVNMTIPASDSVVDLRTESSKSLEEGTIVPVKSVSYSMLRTKKGMPLIEADSYTVEVIEENKCNPDITGGV